MGSRLRILLIVIGLGALLFLMRDLNNRMAELRRLEYEAGRVGNQYEQMVGTKVALEMQVTEAAKQLDLRNQSGKNNEGQPGDTLIVPVPVEGSVAQPAEAQVTPLVLTEKWELWLAMFIDFDPNALPTLPLQATSTPITTPTTAP